MCAAAASVSYMTCEPLEAEPLTGYDPTAALHMRTLILRARFGPEILMQPWADKCTYERAVQVSTMKGRAV